MLYYLSQFVNEKKMEFAEHKIWIIESFYIIKKILIVYTILSIDRNDISGGFTDIL